MTTPNQVRRAAAAQRARVLGLTASRAQADLVRWSHPLPRAQAAGYIRDAVTLQRQVNALVGAGLEAIVQFVDQQARLDADGPQDPISRTMDQIKAAVAKLLSPTNVAAMVAPHGRGIMRWNENKYDNVLGDVLAINDVPANRTGTAFQGWVTENVGLIQGANAEQVEKIRALLFRAQRQGLRAADIQKEIQGIMGSSVNRAKLIARDQSTKFSGQLDRMKQSNAGITHYIWRTSQDERVRATHRDLDGRRFTWAKPPGVGNPGQPVQCRCVAEPDIGALLGDDPEGVAPTQAMFEPETPASRKAARRRHAATIKREQNNIRAARERVKVARRERAKAERELKALGGT